MTLRPELLPPVRPGGRNTVEEEPQACQAFEGDQVTAGFLAADADARWWATASPQDQMEDSMAVRPRPACETISRRYAAALNAHGFPAVVVEGSDPDYDHDYLIGPHTWVLVGDTQVDFTVRQFHSVNGPAGRESQDCQVPLLWPRGQTHPILRFRNLTVVT